MGGAWPKQQSFRFCFSGDPYHDSDPRFLHLDPDPSILKNFLMKFLEGGMARIDFGSTIQIQNSWFLKHSFFLCFAT